MATHRAYVFIVGAVLFFVGLAPLTRQGNGNRALSDREMASIRGLTPCQSGFIDYENFHLDCFAIYHLSQPNECLFWSCVDGDAQTCDESGKDYVNQQIPTYHITGTSQQKELRTDTTVGCYCRTYCVTYGLQDDRDCDRGSYAAGPPIVTHYGQGCVAHQPPPEEAKGCRPCGKGDYVPNSQVSKVYPYEAPCPAEE